MGKKSKKAKKQKKSKKVKLFKKEIVLRLASKKDFLEVEKIEKRNGKDVKVWKIREGIPYWCINSKGEIENKNYILDENTDLEHFNILLLREQVLVTKNKNK